MSRVFYSVPFNADLPGALLDFALSHGHDLHNAVFLFPHARPGKYMVRALAGRSDLPRPILEPSFWTVSGLFAELHRHFAGAPLWNAGPTDRAGLLFECLRETGCDDFFGPGGETDLTAFFFPWAFRLADLFEECLAAGVPPTDITHPEAEAAPFAARILERLGRIFAAYAKALNERGWTTPGLDAHAAAEALRTGRALPDRLVAGKRIYIAGFHTLTRPEEALLHHLTAERGACVILRADPDPAAAHWSCGPLFAWARKERAEILPLPTVVARPSASIRFIQGFDLHSQLAALRDELAAAPPPDPHAPPPPGFAADTAVILPSGDLLVPALHHLPNTDINVSMGRPLAPSPLFRLVETVLRLEEGRKGTERHWRDLLELLGHPAIAGLDPAPPAAGEDGAPPEPGGNIRRELHLFEEVVRAGGAVYVDPSALWADIRAALPPDEAVPAAHDRLFRKIFRICLTGFESPATPHALGTALEGLCSLLLEHGPHLWPRSPIDAECLYRLLQSLIPELLHSVPARLPLPKDALFALARKLAEAERVPFEAEPLTGLQVLGVLEARMLSFRRVFILDAGEHVLPGTPQGDPLLPDALRPALGLPERRSAELPAAHHFFSLIRGAEEAVILWREGGEAGGLFDGKKLKSRFVEELLWEEEKQRGRLFPAQGEDGPLRILADAPAPIAAAPGPVRLGPSVRALVDNLLAKPVSASLLDAFLLCPVRFFHERILGLRQVEAPSEEYDPPAVGVLLHKTLEAFYRERLGLALPAGAEMPETEYEALAETFLTRPELAALARTLPADVTAMLRVSGPERLRRFLRNQPVCTPLALEQSLAAPLRVGREISLIGTVDRLDMREGGAVILDYKTGKIPRVTQSLWADDEPFWDGLDAFDPEDPDLPAFVAAHVPSVQLPVYVYLAAMNASLPPVVQAAWIELAAGGEEAPLFGKTVGPEERERAVDERIPQLLGMVLQNIAGSRAFFPRRGPHCRWCSCKNACMILPTE